MPDSSDPRPSHVTVDAIEGHLARVELPGGHTEDWPLSRLPKGVKEGDVLRLELDGGDLSITRDEAQTQARREQAQAMLDELNRPAPDGDLEL